MNLTTLALSNQNPQSQYRTAMINLDTGLCTLDDTLCIDKKHLIHETDFSHPLLNEQVIPPMDNVYHYEYDDIDGLLSAAQYVYATLLHTDNAGACQFSIKPSPAYKATTPIKEIYFSIFSFLLCVYMLFRALL